MLDLPAYAIAILFGGCAYFNTFYSAKRNFAAAERLYQNPDDRATGQQAALYDKAIQSAAKLVASYPSSKWIDDAVLITVTRDGLPTVTLPSQGWIDFK